MWRRLLRFLASVLLALAPWTPLAHAQSPPAEAEKSERSVSALPYTVLVIYTLAVLTIVCVPSRKA